MKNKLPNDIAAEVALIGSVVIEPALYRDIAKDISADDFYDLRNRELWRCIGECIKQSGQADLVMLEATLKKRGSIDKVDIAYVVDAVNKTPTSERAFHYAEIVRDCGERRRLIRGFSQAAAKLSDTGEEVAEINAFVQQVLLIPSAHSKRTKSFRQAFEKFAAEYREREKRGTSIAGIETGYMMLDYALGGLEKRKLYIIGGRPGMGKSAFALNIAFQMARNNKTAMFFSLEMSDTEIVKRVVALGAGIDGTRIKEIRLDEKERQWVRKIRDTVEDKIIIDDESSRTVQSIMADCIAEKARLEATGKTLDCIFVDHMQLMRASGRNTDRRTQIGEISRDFKLLADRLDCPVVVLSQLSRAARGRSEKRPVLTDLRESGDIEQDADVVILLHRDDYYEYGEVKDGLKTVPAEVIIAKNRDGFTGTFYYDWDAAYTRFTERRSIV